jgi:hypothetical protein
MTAESAPSTGKVIGLMALFVLLGLPLVGYLWETINQLLSLKISTTRALISIPVLLAFIGLMALVARGVRRWQPWAS